MAEPGVDAPMIQMEHRSRMVVLWAVLLVLFLSSLDQTVVGTALPRIVTDLAGNGLYTWVVTAYLLSSTITVPIYGKLSDTYGRKIMLLAGIVVFLAGSWLSGLSQSMEELIAFRALQGIGAGALFPISLAIIGDLFTPRERGRYQGLFGAVFGLSFIVGPFIGGYITDNIDWRWVFYVNMPIGIAALAAIVVVLPNFHPPSRVSLRDLDYAGIVVFTAGVIPLLIGLTNKGLTDSHGNLYGWTDPGVGGLIAIGAVLLLIFVFIESRASQAILPLNLFKNWNFSFTNIAVFLMAFGMFAAVIFLPRYYQAVRGISATKSGYMIWPLLVGLIGSSIMAGRLISQTGKYKVILMSSSLLFVVGSYLMTHLTANTSDPYLWFWMLLMGLGIGPSMSGFTVVVQNSAPARQLGVATSTLTFLRQIGGSVGLAISGTLFSQNFTQLLPKQLADQHVPATIVQHFRSGTGSSGSLTGVGLAHQLQHSLPGVPANVIAAIVTGIHDAFSLAIGDVFWLTVAAGALAFISTVALREVPLRGVSSSSDAMAADVVPGGEVSTESGPRQQAAGQ